MFLTFRTRRGFQAINVSEIAMLDYRSKTVAGQEGAATGLEIRLRTPFKGKSEGEQGSVRLRGEQARQAWLLLAERGLFWTIEEAAAADVDDAD